MANTKGYSEDEWNEAIAKLNNPASSRPNFTSSYDKEMQELLDKFRNREKFTYDLGSDALYKQLADKYQQQGKLAMKDSMGQAAALTGGYGSTYGQQVGQQSYDAYLQGLNDVVPDLYNAAYGRYQDEGNQMLSEYNLLGDMADTEYGQYRDRVSDWQYDEQQRYNRERDLIEDQRYADELAYNRQKYEDETAYSRQQTAYKNLYALILATGYSPSAEELSAAGMSQQEAQALMGKYISENIKPNEVTGYSGGSSGGSGGYNTHGYTTDQIRQLQAAAGISVDGIWGPQTEAAYNAGYRPNGGGYGVSSAYTGIQNLAAAGATTSDVYAYIDAKATSEAEAKRLKTDYLQAKRMGDI